MAEGYAKAPRCSTFAATAYNAGAERIAVDKKRLKWL
jgi:hypothetical protein